MGDGVTPPRETATANKYESAPPGAAGLIESMRSLGYSPEHAVADLVDNAIPAKAEEVHIRFPSIGSKPLVVIADDGGGMSEAALGDAMRLSSKSPREVRGREDLGRYYLGLKTASFSQCRSLTVFSKERGGEDWACRRWDLDIVSRENQWLLAHDAPPDVWDAARQDLERLESGTIVVWSKLDHLERVSGRRLAKKLHALQDRLVQHLGLVFHFFLETKALRIFVGHERVLPQNPFYAPHDCADFPSETIPIGAHRVEIQAHVLPRPDHMPEADVRRLERGQGLQETQGFYLYRNHRLIVDGGWLGKRFSRSQATQLARVEIQIDNEQDDLWQIDVMKSVATFPSPIEKRIIAIAEAACRRSAERLRHVAMRSNERIVTDTEVWDWRIRNYAWKFKLNRQHPLIALLQSEGLGAKEGAALMDLIESTLPLQDYTAGSTGSSPLNSEATNDG